MLLCVLLLVLPPVTIHVSSSKDNKIPGIAKSIIKNIVKNLLETETLDSIKNVVIHNINKAIIIATAAYLDCVVPIIAFTNVEAIFLFLSNKSKRKKWYK